ncbi:hypothetical protein [Legionella clemsonensis]|uniref:Uncharacterized protein n=1 Tax=Legionella clemsonensis TaxID=1867846 RepID=A0A222P1M7_9GAMM|nr:hypothetical protein [Legionella clemsonensis]ASQ45675.1 hypothetical protein clem_05595 [Legionella clemsonensis]
MTINQSLYEAIKHLSQELELGGERYTGQVYASVGAQVAYTEFIAYLNSLPPQLQSDLMELKTSSGITLGHIIKDLNNRECIETASSNLKELLNNPLNKTVLHTRPHLTQEQIDTIKNKYGKKRLFIEGSEPGIILPKEYLATHLGRIEINNGTDYLNFLVAFPPNCYDSLFKFAKINCQPSIPNELLDAIDSGAINSEQLSALNEAISQY